MALFGKCKECGTYFMDMFGEFYDEETQELECPLCHSRDIDGGVNETNLKDVVESGASGVVIGRAVFKAENFQEAYNKLLNLGRSYEK